MLLERLIRVLRSGLSSFKAIGPFDDVGPRVCARLADPSECRPTFSLKGIILFRSRPSPRTMAQSLEGASPSNARGDIPNAQRHRTSVEDDGWRSIITLTGSSLLSVGCYNNAVLSCTVLALYICPVLSLFGRFHGDACSPSLFPSAWER